MVNDIKKTDMNAGISVAQEEPEVLGSVTHNVETQKGEKPSHVPLRTSARVSKKLRLDSQIAVTQVQEKAPEKKDAKSKEVQPPPKKRANMLWSAEDKNVFFKALNEYGKNFVAIQKHMNDKRKKRGISQNITKNKDQARHFYYRTWHKISKYINFPPDVKKVTQELYGLINYGEFRKRVGFFSEKYSTKLNELIYSGATQMRLRGKTIRIKTPVCRALRKLNQLEDSATEFKLPTKVSVELRPKDNATWLKVQMLAMNPRVRVTVPLHTPLFAIIRHLQWKWQPTDVKLKNKATDDSRSLLRVAPKSGLKIVSPSVRAGEFITSARISLLSYEERLGSSSSSIEDMKKGLHPSCSKGGKANKGSKKQPSTEQEKQRKLDAELESKKVDIAVANQDSQSEIVSFAVQQLLALNSEQGQESTSNKKEKRENAGAPKKDTIEKRDAEQTSGKQTDEEDIINVVRSGWTIKNVEARRVGDLYLMFGSGGRLEFEYWWEENVSVSSAQSGASTSSNISLPSGQAVSSTSSNKISNMLKKLVSIAKMVFEKDKPMCRCGHICKPPTTGKTGTSRAKGASKATKIAEQAARAAEQTAKVAEQKSTSSGSACKVGCSSENSAPSSDSTFVSPEVLDQSQNKSNSESFADQFIKLQSRYIVRRRRPGDHQIPVVPRLVTLYTKPTAATAAVPAASSVQTVSSGSRLSDVTLTQPCTFLPMVAKPAVATATSPKVPSSSRSPGQARNAKVSRSLETVSIIGSSRTAGKSSSRTSNSASSKTSTGSGSASSRTSAGSGNSSASFSGFIGSCSPSSTESPSGFSSSRSSAGSSSFFNSPCRVPDPVLLDDEDSRLSECSSISRFVEKTLSQVLNHSNSSSDGLSTPVISTRSSDKDPEKAVGRISPQWLYSEASNLSYSSLLAELDHTAAQLKGTTDTTSASVPNPQIDADLSNFMTDDGLLEY